MRVSSAFFSSQAAAAAATIWRVLSGMIRSLLGAGALTGFFAGLDFAAERDFAVAFTPLLLVALLAPADLVAVLVRLVCFAAVLLLDFLLEPAISSPR
jgi:hypothetical protein